MGILFLAGLFYILLTPTFNAVVKIFAIIGWVSFLYIFYRGRTEEEIEHDKIFTSDEYYYGDKGDKK